MFAYGAREERVLAGRSISSPGPGNIYVAAAKRLLRGVGRHRLGGRSHGDRRPRRRHAPTLCHVAADLLSQAEHDPLAASVLVTDQ